MAKAAEVEERPKEARLTAVTARIRLYGAQEENALDQKWGSALGRQVMWNNITQKQFLAGEDFYHVVNNEAKAKQSPSWVNAPAELKAFMDEDEYTAWCNEVRAAYNDLWRSVTDHPEGLHYWQTLYKVIMEGVDVNTMEMVGFLRCGLNLCHKHFRG